ncbi:MAG: helix-turn-helix domain-containing protein [Gammaproteobacteria bacterium]|nr:helix-turn-helix domain-containing protein [Gammaproteobacteria bacterium]
MPFITTTYNRGMDLADRISNTRKSKGLSQSQLATIIGVSRGACGQWETGYSTPSSQNLRKLATVLEVHFEWLATGRGNNEMSFNKVSEPTSPAYSNPQDEPLPGELLAFNSWAMRLPDEHRSRVFKVLTDMQELHYVCTSSKDENN